MIDPRCAACPVAAGMPCYGPCGWAAGGDPFLIKSVVDRAAMPPPDSAPAPSVPPLLARIGNLTRAVVSHVAAGLPTLGAEAVAARLAVCEPCPQRLPGGVCAGCGCSMEAPPWRNKAHWADTVCPEGLWPKS